MGRLLAYSGTTTKIQAMRSRLLTSEKYRELAAMQSVPEALGYLKQQPAYREIFANVDESALHRNQIEKMLYKTVYLDFRKIYRFATVRQRKFLDLYFHRYEIAALKSCMRMFFDEREITLEPTILEEFFTKHMDFDLPKLAMSKNLDEFINNLKGSAYYDVLLPLSNIDRPTLFDYEMRIDLYYFKWFWERKDKEKIFDKNELTIFMDSYGTKMDLLNTRWIYRSKKYFNMDAADIYALLIPVYYRLKKDEIKAMVEASTLDEFNAVLRNSYYGRHYKELDMETLDQTYNSIRHHVHRKNARRDPYSVATIISYLFEKEHEINKITIILECVRYGLSTDQSLEYIHH